MTDTLVVVPAGAALITKNTQVMTATEYRNQIIQELIEKADAEAKDVANRSDVPLDHTWQSQVAWWLKSQLEGGE